MYYAPKRLMKIHYAPDPTAAFRITNENIRKHFVLNMNPFLVSETLGECGNKIGKWALI